MEDQQTYSSAILHHFLTLIRYQHRSSAAIQQQVQITGRQVAVLRFLLEVGPSMVTEVSRFLYVREATASTMLDRMEAGGYITRTRSTEDNRKVIIEPTQLGKEIAQRAPLGMVALLRDRLPRQSAEDLQAIESALCKLVTLCGIDETLLD